MATPSQRVLPSILRGQTSSVIREATYSADTRELRITFMSGRVYAYDDVPPAIYEAFAAAPSKGVFFNIAIRGRYRFRRIEPEPRAGKLSR